MSITSIKGFHLSTQQAHVWSLQTADQIYQTQCALRVERAFNLKVFQQAAQRMIDRHTILRTSFSLMPGMDVPVQVINSQAEAGYALIDLGNLPPDTQEGQLQSCFAQIQHEDFDLTQNSLLHIRLLRLSMNIHIILLNVPALCADEMTLTQYVTELSRAYTLVLQGKSWEEEEEPLRYVDVAAWQDELLLEESAKLSIGYWQDIDLSQLLTQHLPLEREGYGQRITELETEDANQFWPQIVEVPLDAMFAKRVRALTDRHSVSIPAYVLACWAILCQRLTNEPHCLIGTARNGRPTEELTSAFGLYTRFVPLDLYFTDTMSFEQALLLVNTILEKADKEQLCFTWNENPFLGDIPHHFPVSFEYSIWPSSFEMGTQTLTLVKRWSCAEPFGLKLSARLVGERLQLELQSASRRLGRAQLGQLAALLRTLLVGAEAQPRLQVGALPLLEESEQTSLLQVGQAATQPLPVQSLQELFERQVEQLPDHLAVMSANNQLTYRQLEARANHLARVLHQRGVGPNVLVGLCLERSASMLVGLLGILKAGGAYLPLDPESPSARFIYQLQESQAALLLTQRALIRHLPLWEGKTVCLEDLELEEGERAGGEAPAPRGVNPEARLWIDPGSLRQSSMTPPRRDEALPSSSSPLQQSCVSSLEDLAYVIYTSGSTGRPKGVMIRQRSAVNYALALCECLGAEVGWQYATVSTLSADLGNTAIFGALASGGCVQVLDYETVTDAEAMLHWVKRHPIDVLKIVPSHLSALLTGEQAQGLLPRQALVLGGEALPTALLERLQEMGGSRRIFNHYGPTETTVGVLVNPLGRSMTARPTSEAISLGQPIANSEVYILDGRMQVAPRGVTGELYLGGAGLAIGYVKLPEQTAERFVPHPWSSEPGARLYRTGDLAFYSQRGTIEFVGRRDGQVKLRGYRIELGEIEARLKQHQEVRNSVVVLQKEAADAPAQLIGYVMTRTAEGPTSEVLRAWVGQELPAYMVPARFLRLDALPLTPNGKVDRQHLSRLKGVEERTLVADADPRSPVEEALVQMWRDLLGVSGVGRNDHFFRLGGHSLLAMQLIAQVKAVLGVDIEVAAVFQAPMVARLAGRIEQALRTRAGVEVPALVAQARPAEIPLSFAQQRLWFLDQLDPGVSTYLVPRVGLLSGELDVRAWEKSLQELVRRQETLRTTFEEREGQPVQVIHEACRYLLPVIDLQNIAQAKQEVLARQLAEQEAQRPMDLCTGPLLRTALVRKGNREHLLFLTLHHITTDAWSTGVLMGELKTLYQAEVKGLPSPLPDLPIRYADYAIWQREFLQGERLEQQLAYWRTHLAGLSPLIFPTDHPRPPVQTFRGAQEELDLPAALHEGLVALSRSAEVTLFMLLLAAFQVLLMRYSGQEDIGVGIPIANRTQAEVEGVIGFFANTLVMRTDLSGNPTFVQLLQRVREVSLSAYTHQDIPFEKVVEEMSPQRDLSRSPLFQVMFVWQQTDRVLEELAGVSVSPFSIGSTISKFDLTLFASERAKGLSCALEYNTDLFEAETITRILAHFETLLDQMVQNPQTRIFGLPLLTAAEHQQVLVEWNATQAEYPQDVCLHQRVSQQGQRFPDAIAVVFEDEHLSYQVLNRRANQLAHSLQSFFGVGPEELVGVCMLRGSEMIVALLGILKAGGAYLPLDPAYPTKRLTFMLQDTAASLVLTTRSTLPSAWFAEGVARVVYLEEEANLLANLPTEAPRSQVTLDNLAYLMYTSGSTGQPKGVSVLHRGIIRLVVSANYVQWGSHEILLQLAPLTFDASTFEIWGALLTGARLVLFPAGPVTLSELAQFLDRSGVTILWLTASLFHQMVEQHLTDLTKVRQVLAGGEVLSVPHVKRLLASFGGGKLINGYGPTENTTFTCCHVMDRKSRVEDSVSIGCPISNTQVYILDACLQPVPVGVVGELYTGGEGLSRGYFQCPDVTAERFVPHPYSRQAGMRLYRTGDLVRYRPDGTLEYVGRLDQQIKLRGYRIEPGEVEAVLREHPSTQECAVVLREDEPGAKRLVAYLVAGAPNHQEKPESYIHSVRSHVQERLPAYMVPSAFVLLPTLPLLPNGKLDRRALPQPFWGRSPSDETFCLPRNAAERALAALWAELLRVKYVGIRDNFFELGGDSILSLQIIARAKQRGLHFTVKQLFQSQTIEQLSQVVQSETSTLAEQGLVLGSVPLTPIQHWFFDLHLSAPHHWNQSLFLQVAQAVPSAFFHQLVGTWLTQHDALRLRYKLERSGTWRQVLATPDPHAIPFTVMDLAELDKETQERTVPQLAASTQASLDLTQGPLLRVVQILRGRGETSLLLLVIHHLAVDGVSWRILLEDLQIAFEQMQQGQPIRLPAKTSSFQAWAEHLVEYAGKPELLQELDVWLTRSALPPSSLPRDFLKGETSVSSTQRVSVRLSREETGTLLQEVVARLHTQINEVLLTALAQTLTEWTGSKAVWVDLEGHGREDLFADLDVSRTVGWFTSLFPVCLDLSGAASVLDALKRVKEQLRAIPSHGIGYGILRSLCPDPTVRERLRAQPAAEISFNYLGQFDQALSPSVARTRHLQMGFSPFSAGPAHHLHDPRTYLLNVTGQISQGQLTLTWSYSQHIHRAETIGRLAKRFQEVLCHLLEQAQTHSAAGLTPSDFPLASLDQSLLDQIMQQVGSATQIEDLYPLSPMQEGLLFHTLYAPGSGVYVTQRSWQINGPLQVSSLQAALQQLIERHTILRTRFLWQGLPRPLQLVQRQVPLLWASYDWQELGLPEQQAGLSRLLQEDRERGFSLDTAPLLRLILVQLHAEVFFLLLSSHHILLDGWSMPLLLAELRALYQAAFRREQAQLPAVRPYRDYIAWLQARDSEQTEPFWRAYLAGFTTPNALPKRHGAASRGGGTLATERLACSLEFSASLKEVAGRMQVTLNTLIQGAWAILLSRYCGSSDVVFGATTSGRPAELAGMETMIGLFITTLPVRVQVRPQATLSDWLHQLQAEQISAREYEATPLVQIQACSEVSGGEALFESLLVYENYPHGVSPLDGESALSIEARESVEHPHYPLMLTLVPAEAGLRMSMQYDETLFEAGLMAQMFRHLQRLLQAMTVQEEPRLIDLEILSEAELDQILVEWNQTQAEYPQELFVHQLVEQQVERTPDALALVFEEVALTYAALNRRANQVAHALLQHGLGPGDLVGLYLDRSMELVVGLLAVLKAGGAYVPLDPATPPQRLVLLLQDSQVQLLLAQAPMLELAGRVRCVDLSVVLSESETVPLPTFRSSEAGGEQVAYMIYTSGSTGQPKGVLIPHRAVLNVFASMARRPGMTAQDRVLAVTSYSFDIAALELLLPLTLGASIYLASQEQIREGSALIDLLQASGATVLQATPSLWRLLLLTGWTGITGLKIWCGGEALPADLAEKLQVWGEQVWNLYGPTETTIWSSVEEVEKGASAISIGRPIDNTRMYVLGETGQVVPLGVVGELYIAGLGVGQGYWQRAELTAERFVPDPWSSQPGGRLYRTGDQVYWTEERKLRYVGRRDQQVKLRGYRIELGEIEMVLNEHESVQEGVVVMREDEPGDPHLVAYLVPKPGASLSGSVLRAYLQERLPAPLIPAMFVKLSALPLTPNGKVDRQALPSPDGVGDGKNGEQERPRTPLEEVLAGLWGEVLGRRQMGREANFFELGGHSLLATRLVARVRVVLGVEMPLRAVFEAPTVLGLAERVEHALRTRSGFELPPLLALPRPAHLPLSFAQARLWFLDQLEPGSATYLVPTANLLLGQLQVRSLEQSLQELIQRHESLRTTFESCSEQAVQVIHDVCRCILPLIDLQQLSPERREEVARRLANQEAGHPMDLAIGPLLRTSLLRLSSEEHALLLTLHHIITDGWSNEVLIDELTTLYQVHLVGEAFSLPALPLQYADYALWQREFLRGEVLERQVAHWRSQLMGLSPLALPIDHPRPRSQTFQGARQSVVWPQDLLEGLQTLSREAGVTLFMTLLAAFQVLLARYSGQTDVAVGTPIANRTHAEIEGLIGFFVNTLVMRTDLSGNPSFVQLLQRVRKVCLEAYAHQDIPFEKIVEELEPQRDLSYSPLFQVMLVWQQAESVPEALAGVSVSPFSVESTVSRFDLTLWLTERGRGLSCALEYNTDLFEAETIVRMLTHFETLLEGMVQNPQMRIFELPLLTTVEYQQVLVEWNATQAEYLQDVCLHQLVLEQVQRSPDAIAIAFEDEHLSYQALNRRANQLAHYLQSFFGVGPEVLVGVCLLRGSEMIVALLAILKAGGAYLPLDPAYPTKRLTFLLQDTAASLVLATRSTLPSAWFAEEVGVRVVYLEEEANRLSNLPTETPTSQVTLDNLAYMIYTSGSTGKPKAVMVTHGNVVRLFAMTRHSFSFQAQDVWTLFHSTTFDFSVWELWGALLHGARLLVVPSWLIRSPQEFSQFLEEEQVTILNQTPTAFRQLIQVDQSATKPRALALRLVIFGGEALDLGGLRPWLARHGDEAPQLVNMYGITETTVHVTCRPLTGIDIQSHQGSVIGAPLADLQCYVLDGYQQPVPPGIPAELYVGGLGLSRGYWQRADVTAERFVPHPWSRVPGARLYRTGDVVRYRPDGTLDYVGRRDQQVKIRGYRIEPGEIEAVLREHPSIQDCAVVLREDEPGRKRLVAYLVVRAQHHQDKPEISTRSVRSFLQKLLPAYMIPSVFVTLDALPQTSSGKVDRRALPHPDWKRSPNKGTFLAPRTAVENALAAIWAEVLHVKQVGARDKFFELGGDSILSMQVIARAKQRGLHFTPKQLFQYQTIEQLSQVVNRETSTLAEQGLVLGSVPLTPIQHWFFDLHLSAPHHWNQSLFLQVAQEVPSAFFHQLVGTWLTQHDALRLRYKLERSGTWRQVLVGSDPHTIPFTVIDLAELDKETQNRMVPQLAAETQASLDLTQGPLLRVVLFHLGRGEHPLLLLVIHHLAVDGVSWRILLEDLQIAFGQVQQGQPIRLPDKTGSFQAWAEHLVEYAGKPELLQELDAWLTRSALPPSSLPRDKPSGETLVSSTQRVSVRLSREETGDLLREVSARLHTQINEVLLTALAVTLSEWTGSKAVWVDLEGHGREDLFADLDVSRTVGWFTSLFPVCLDLTGATSELEALRCVKEQLRAIPSHGIGYGILRSLCPDLTVRERLSTQPPAEVSFNYLGQFETAMSFSSEGKNQFQIGMAPVSAGPLHHLQDRRPHLLEVIGQISQGQLTITWNYSRQVHRQVRIGQLANRFKEVLCRLIDQAQVKAGAGLTPSDFPLVSLDQSLLDQIVQQVGSATQIEDLYPLSPMQEGLLFHTLYAPDSGVYVIQMSWQIQGVLQISSLQAAFQQVIERHAILRTRFLWEGLPQPLQLVQRQVPFPWTSHDWQALGEPEQQAGWSRLLQEDRERGFALDTAPLLRLTLVHLRPEAFFLLLTCHHILLDGWSMPLLLAELRMCYQAACQGREPRLTPVRPYRDYIAWLQSRDQGQAEQFWRAYLAGFTTPNRMSSQAQARSRIPEKLVTERLISHEMRNEFLAELRKEKSWRRPKKCDSL